MADVITFLSVFPEFKRLATETPAAAQFWITQAGGQLALGRLGANADLAVYLYTAHNLVLNAQDVADTENGALPGDTLGPTASKSVDGLSISYDSGSISMAGAGAYNATSYGQRLWKMLQAASLGGFYASTPNRPYVYVGAGLPWAQ